MFETVFFYPKPECKLEAINEKASCLSDSPNSSHNPSPPKEVNELIEKSMPQVGNEKNEFIVRIGDHIAYRYEIIKLAGKGSFGVAVECFDHKCKEKVAIKILRNEKRFHKQGQKEIKILDRIRRKDPDDITYSVRYKQYFVFRAHLCITFELLYQDLHTLLKSNDFMGLKERYVKKIIFQMLICLINLRKLKIIHCDIKPDNVLLVKENQLYVKIIDFGSACGKNDSRYTYI